MHRVVLTLGSNIEPSTNLLAAVRLLRQEADIVGLSHIYETAPVGLLEQPAFLNAAALITTTYSPVALKDGLLRDIEDQLLRVRGPDKNAPRTIDLDIALYDNAVLRYSPADGRTRHIPDPDLLRFLHVALPVADVCPHFVHPATFEPLHHIAKRLLWQATLTGPCPVLRVQGLSLQSAPDQDADASSA